MIQKSISFRLDIVLIVLIVRKFAVIFLALSIVCSSFVGSYNFTNAQTSQFIDINGYTWDHTTITIGIAPKENELWWKPSYLNATLHGIAQWNDAIQQFATNYPDFAYLSQISLVPTITHEPSSSFDVYVRWKAECRSESTIGQTQTIVVSPCRVLNSTVYLAAKAPSGHIMTEVDMQNIIVHEIGHTLGLSHSNYSPDVMYSIVTYLETVKPISTLNLYAISQNFKWISNSTQFSSSNLCPQEMSVVLPTDISYVQLQIEDENLPVYSPPKPIEYAVELIRRPEAIFVMVLVGTLIAIVAIVAKRTKNTTI